MAVALDAAGREVARWRGPNTPTGWQQLLAWGAALGARCRSGIEGAWNYGRGLAHHLVAAGAEVYEVNPRWTALSTKLELGDSLVRGDIVSQGGRVGQAITGVRVTARQVAQRSSRVSR